MLLGMAIPVVEFQNLGYKTRVLYMSFDKFLLTVESRDLSQAHTGLISSRSFQNYAFKVWLSLETMKLWLLVQKHFFNHLDYKADIGHHFHKSEKSARLTSKNAGKPAFFDASF